ncbi:uncharacterized protein L203_105186 [Cryptococcus depauperatus CBS 7841]|uniref:Uncharacterized protein n=1 Tax=Cryptococcus depauperatus CBS 7841 TaxID=1295531 RepID=A0AAJ8M3T8_9TREE
MSTNPDLASRAGYNSTMNSPALFQLISIILVSFIRKLFLLRAILFLVVLEERGGRAAVLGDSFVFLLVDSPATPPTPMESELPGRGGPKAS